MDSFEIARKAIAEDIRESGMISYDQGGETEGQHVDCAQLKDDYERLADRLERGVHDETEFEITVAKKMLLKAKLAQQCGMEVECPDMREEGGEVSDAVAENYLSYLQEENFLGVLGADTRASAREWNGPNIPYGDDSNRPNLIRECTMLESATAKINCLRKLRDAAAMNPYYQSRIDRYIDEITDTYEPTNKPGTIPGNEFEETNVGEDTVKAPHSHITPVSQTLEEKMTLQKAAAISAGTGAAVMTGVQIALARKCKKRYPNDRKKFRSCMWRGGKAKGDK